MKGYWFFVKKNNLCFGDNKEVFSIFLKSNVDLCGVSKKKILFKKSNLYVSISCGSG